MEFSEQIFFCLFLRLLACLFSFTFLDWQGRLLSSEQNPAVAKGGGCRRKRLLLRSSDLVLLGNLRCTGQARFGGGRKSWGRERTTELTDSER